MKAVYRLIHHLFTFLFVSFLFYACASIGTPTGGPKDTKPPVLLNSIPKDQSTNFKGRVIALQFNEYIELKNIKQGLLITPSLSEDNDYEYKINQPNLILTFKRDLAPNTTYVLDFGEVVTDVTEKNKAENLKLAFSTGSSIDSSFIQGTIRDLYTNKPLIKGTVGIYNAEDTLDIEKNKPLYYTKTDSLGKFKLRNLKPAKYKIYALLEDKKKDNIYNGDIEEKIAFLDKPVDLTNRPFALVDELRVASYDLKPIKLLRPRKNRHYVEWRANKEIDNYEVKFTDNQYDTAVLHTKEKDFVRFFHTSNTDTDSIEITLTVKDSLGNSATETNKIKFEQVEKLRPLALSFSEFPKSGTALEPRKDSTYQVNLTFRFNKPMKEIINIDSIFYKVSPKDTIGQKLALNDFQWNENRTAISISKKIFSKEPINFTLKKGVFISIENDSSAARPIISYPIKKIEEFGTISGQVRSQQYKSFIIQLLDEGYKQVEQEIANTTNFKFTYVKPGKKRIRVLIDENNDGKWEKGDFKNRIPPEKIFFFKEAIQVKPNWDYEDNLIDLDDAEQVK
ncbi:MAG: Ig-like domain-containing protein [Thermoflexibacter sp.]